MLEKCSRASNKYLAGPKEPANDPMLAILCQQYARDHWLAPLGQSYTYCWPWLASKRLTTLKTWQNTSRNPLHVLPAVKLMQHYQE